MTENVPNNSDPYSGIKLLVRLLCYLICFGLVNYLWECTGLMAFDHTGNGEPDLFPWALCFIFTQQIGFHISKGWISYFGV
jgi:hypothetical protein